VADPLQAALGIGPAGEDRGIAAEPADVLRQLALQEARGVVALDDDGAVLCQATRGQHEMPLGLMACGMALAFSHRGILAH
jgi:hypothetical protein